MLFQLDLEAVEEQPCEEEMSARERLEEVNAYSKNIEECVKGITICIQKVKEIRFYLSYTWDRKFQAMNGSENSVFSWLLGTEDCHHQRRLHCSNLILFSICFN